MFVTDGDKRIATIDTLTIDNKVAVGTLVDVIRYQYDNHLGSASLELDESAAIISYEEYHPFGTTSYRSGRTETEVSLKRYRYVGKERDEETGLYNYGFRLYAPWLGRFISVDPLQHDYPYYTPYQYAGNKPIIAIDLDGLESKNVVQDEETGQQIQPPQVLQDNLKEQKPHVPELDATWFRNKDGSFTLIDVHANSNAQINEYEPSLMMYVEEWTQSGNKLEQFLKTPARMIYSFADDLTVLMTSQALVQDIVGLEDAVNLNGTYPEPKEKLQKGFNAITSLVGPLLSSEKELVKIAPNYSTYANKTNWTKAASREAIEELRLQVTKSAIDNLKSLKQNSIFGKIINAAKDIDKTYSKERK